MSQEFEELPDHLGGHENMTNLDKGVIEYFIKNHNIKSFLDVGCGTGGQLAIAKELGLEVLGIEGDHLVKKEESIKNNIIIHDFTQGEIILSQSFDLGYTVEFVEHVEAQYIKNWMRPLQACKMVIMTHAFPNQEGWHHVNCKDCNYWDDIFTAFGFQLNVDITNEARHSSTMHFNFMRQQSLVFVNTIDPQLYTIPGLKFALNNLIEHNQNDN